MLLVNKMGNDNTKERRRALLPPNPRLEKGYSCYYYKLSSFPMSLEKYKCTVLDRTPDYKLYTLRDDTIPEKIYSQIPYIYVSSAREPNGWDDYFKIGTIIKTNEGGRLCDAEIIDIHYDSLTGKNIDIKELKTGFTRYGVRPTNFYFNVEYYRDW